MNFHRWRQSGEPCRLEPGPITLGKEVVDDVEPAQRSMNDRPPNALIRSRRKHDCQPTAKTNTSLGGCLGVFFIVELFHVMLFVVNSEISDVALNQQVHRLVFGK